MTGAAVSLAPIDFAAMPTIGAIAKYHATRTPGRVAIQFEGVDTRWADLDRHASLVANALISDGFNPGSRIAFLGRGSNLFFELLFGAARAGVVLCPIQWRLAVPEVVQIMVDCGANLLFADRAMGEAAAAVCAALPGVTVVWMDQGSDPHKAVFGHWRDAADDSEEFAPVQPDQVALQLYTSGTTGIPKGVMITHANILAGRRAGMEAGMDWNSWQEDDVSLIAMPVGHVGGVAWGLVAFFNGATAIIHSEFSPEAVLDAIEHQGVSKLFVVPTALKAMLRAPRVRSINYRRLRYILYGASPIALDLLREATDVFGCGFCQQYGMTETCGTIVYLPPEDHHPDGNERMRSAGLPMPGVELRIMDASRRTPLAAGEVGEVETRSVANMLGYWNRPDATTETLDHDGWLRTGDAGYLDGDGYLFIHDRLKDMICSGAENVYPAEVENAIYSHPAVCEIGVFGVPDDRWGEVVRAAVVLNPGYAADPGPIIAFARTKIAAFKVPKKIDFVAELPRGPTGKILRRALRDPYWAGHLRQVN